jgi:pimeloyl-ACP methyl ester carboxylesterase
MNPCVVILDESCDLLEPEVSQFVPTVVFRRLGGFVIDPEVACEQLHQLIVARMASTHVIYVAASFAGFTALLLGSHYPSLVAGLILVDPSHPDQVERAMEAFREAKVLDSEATCGFREYLPDRAPEWWTVGCARAKAIVSLGDLKVVVLAAGKPELKGTVPPGLYDKLVADRHALLRRYSSSTSHGAFSVVAESGHGIAVEHPRAVIDAIRELVGDRGHYIGPNRVAGGN